MGQLLKKHILKKRKEKLREHAILNAESCNAMENKIGTATDEFLKALTDKNCLLVATLLDGVTGFQMGLCNIDVKKENSRKIYTGMLAANIQYYALQFGVSTDKILGDIAESLGKYSQYLGLDE